MTCDELPPLEPGQRGVLIFDGERLAWATGAAGGVLKIGPDGDLAFVNLCAEISNCPQIDAIRESIPKPKPKAKKKGA